MDNCVTKNETLSPVLLKLIVTHFLKDQPMSQQYEGIHVYGYTEYSHDGMTFRSHPNYKNDGPWFDFVLIAWTMPSDKTHKKSKQSANDDNSPDYVELPVMKGNKVVGYNKALLIPAKLICFIKDHCNDMYAIVQSCQQQRKKMSVLTYR